MDRGTRSRSVRDVIANPTKEEAEQLRALKERLRGAGHRAVATQGPDLPDAAGRPPTLEEIEDMVRRVVREELDARGL